MAQRKSETREEYNARMNVYMKAKFKATQELLEAYKMKQGCTECGYNEHHAGLQFDHINERFGDAGKRISAMTVRGWDIVIKHIQENCDVVCATHHSIRTWHRKMHRQLKPSVPGEISVFSYDMNTPCNYPWCLVAVDRAS